MQSLGHLTVPIVCNSIERVIGTIQLGRCHNGEQMIIDRLLLTLMLTAAFSAKLFNPKSISHQHLAL